MTNSELIALLREARKVVSDAENLWWEQGNKEQELVTDALLERIDAALAEHEAEEQVEVTWLPNGPKGFSGYFKGRIKRTTVYQTKDGLWWASAENIGPFETCNEAKSAAVEAARGLL